MAVFFCFFLHPFVKSVGVDECVKHSVLAFAVRVPLSFKEKRQVPSDCDKTRNLIISVRSSGVSALNAWQSACLSTPRDLKHSAISKDEYNADIFQNLSLGKS